MIDIHAHIGSFDGYDLSEPTLLAEVAEAGVELVLVSNIDGAAVPGKTRNLSETEANRATVRFVRSYPGTFRGLLWGRPDRGDASDLEPFASLRVDSSASATGADPAAPGARPWTRRLFVGLKLHPEMNAVFADAPAMDPYLRFAARHGYPVVAHCDGQVDEASAPRLLALARRHPDVPVVLYHTGFQGPHEPAIAAAEAALGLAGEGPPANLWLETAQLPPAAALEAVERVGAGRVLFGTDATFYGRGHYARYRPLLDALEKALSPADLARVTHENARALFRLQEPPALDPDPSP
jgi:predicted TIM-barrel fold metal-dependent hydrolase